MSAARLYGAYVSAQDASDFITGDVARFRQHRVTDTGMSCPIWGFDCTTPLHAVIGSLMAPVPAGELLVIWRDSRVERIDRDRLVQSAAVSSVSLDMVRADAVIPDYACAYLIDVPARPALGAETDACSVVAVLDLHRLDMISDSAWSQILLPSKQGLLIADEDDWGMARLYRSAYEMLLHRAQLVYDPRRACVDPVPAETAFARRRAFETTLLPALVHLLTQEQYRSCMRVSCFETYPLLRPAFFDFTAYRDAWQVWSAEVREQQGARLCADRLRSVLMREVPGFRDYGMMC